MKLSAKAKEQIVEQLIRVSLPVVELALLPPPPSNPKSISTSISISISIWTIVVVLFFKLSCGTHRFLYSTHKNRKAGDNNVTTYSESVLVIQCDSVLDLLMSAVWIKRTMIIIIAYLIVDYCWLLLMLPHSVQGKTQPIPHKQTISAKYTMRSTWDLQSTPKLKPKQNSTSRVQWNTIVELVHRANPTRNKNWHEQLYISTIYIWIIIIHYLLIHV